MSYFLTGAPVLFLCLMNVQYFYCSSLLLKKPVCKNWKSAKTFFFSSGTQALSSCTFIQSILGEKNIHGERKSYIINTRPVTHRLKQPRMSTVYNHQQLPLWSWRGNKHHQVLLCSWRGTTNQQLPLRSWRGTKNQQLPLWSWRGTTNQQLPLWSWRGILKTSNYHCDHEGVY